MKRHLIAAAVLTVFVLGVSAQPPAGTPKTLPAAKTGGGPSLVPGYDLDHTTTYMLKIKGAYSVQSPKGLMETPVEVNCDLRVAALLAPTATTEGVVEIEFVTVRYFANEKTGNITFDSTKPPRAKPDERDRSKPAFRGPSQDAADELFQKIVGSRVQAYVDSAGRITRFTGDENLAGRPNMGPYVPALVSSLRLLLGTGGSNTDPGFNGTVRDRQHWKGNENIGTKDKPVILETDYEVRSATTARVEITTIGRLKSDTPATNEVLHTVQTQGVIVWDPKAAQLISARTTEANARAETTTLGTIKRSDKWDVTLQRGTTEAKARAATPAPVAPSVVPVLPAASPPADPPADEPKPG